MSNLIHQQLQQVFELTSSHARLTSDEDLFTYMNNEHLVLEIVFPENNIMLSL